jgi:hypothetical protein
MQSGNHALRLASILERSGYVFEVVATPCQIAKGGCGYSIKFPMEYKDLLVQKALVNNIGITAIYRAIPGFSKIHYEMEPL